MGRFARGLSALARKETSQHRCHGPRQSRTRGHLNRHPLKHTARSDRVGDQPIWGAAVQLKGVMPILHDYEVTGPTMRDRSFQGTEDAQLQVAGARVARQTVA